MKGTLDVILDIDIDDKDFIVTKAPEPKTDQTGQQRTDKQTGEPMWATQVVVTDDSGGEVIKINTHGDKPDVRVGDVVDVFGLVALPWATNGRAGVAFTAKRIKAAE